MPSTKNAANSSDGTPGVVSAETQGFRITFRSAEALEKQRTNETEQKPSASASLTSRSSHCALHITDAQPAFLDSLPTPTRPTS
ncbi:hypothetical protein IAT40_003484 [Kwoniella sp. CBS 6097]